MRTKIFCTATLLTGLLAACGKEEAAAPASTPSAYQNELMTQLLDAKPGDVIEIPAGRHVFDRSLSLTVDGVTLKGAGMNESILSFKGQIAGAEGLLVTANDFTIEDLAIEDTIGDALKISDGENIVIRRVRTEWTGGAKTENGAYGIYPVQVRNLLLEESVAIGASDAGLYVGQSQNVIVRNNRAEKNVAGIEIENTFDADVYGNTATGNTGGILVFNMPNLPQPGARTRIYDNDVFENNHRNFGHEGTPVASIPAGSGVVVNSNDYVEIFDNRISENKTANVIISSVYSTGYADGQGADDFDPYPEAIYIYGNQFEGGGDNPDGLALQALKIALAGPLGRLPDVLWDGYADAEKFVDGALPPEMRICIQNNGARVVNADQPNDNKSPRIAEESEFDCALPKLSAVALTGPLEELTSAQ